MRPALDAGNSFSLNLAIVFSEIVSSELTAHFQTFQLTKVISSLNGREALAGGRVTTILLVAWRPEKLPI